MDSLEWRRRFKDRLVQRGVPLDEAEKWTVEAYEDGFYARGKPPMIMQHFPEQPEDAADDDMDYGD